jgi:hypothetical protein
MKTYTHTVIIEGESKGNTNKKGGLSNLLEKGYSVEVINGDRPVYVFTKQYDAFVKYRRNNDQTALMLWIHDVDGVPNNTYVLPIKNAKHISNDDFVQKILTDHLKLDYYKCLCQYTIFESPPAKNKIVNLTNF